MTEEEKAKKYDEIVEQLWNGALHGNALQSTICANLIRQLDIPSPDGADPESA